MRVLCSIRQCMPAFRVELSCASCSIPSFRQAKVGWNSRCRCKPLHTTVVLTTVLVHFLCTNERTSSPPFCTSSTYCCCVDIKSARPPRPSKKRGRRRHVEAREKIVVGASAKAMSSWNSAAAAAATTATPLAGRNAIRASSCPAGPARSWQASELDRTVLTVRFR